MIEQIGLIGAREMYNSLVFRCRAWWTRCDACVKQRLSSSEEQKSIAASFRLSDPGHADQHLSGFLRLHPALLAGLSFDCLSIRP